MRAHIVVVGTLRMAAGAVVLADAIRSAATYDPGKDA